MNSFNSYTEDVLKKMWYEFLNRKGLNEQTYELIEDDDYLDMLDAEFDVIAHKLREQYLKEYLESIKDISA